MGSTTPSHLKIADDNTQLGNRSRLEKIDKLRELAIDIDLPQIVVVGDQSSGKSSVLESLTGFSFPRAVGLCTRYTTQITCRRETQAYIDISIIPGPSASASKQQAMQAFKSHVSDARSGGINIGKILEEANLVMGIRPSGKYEGNAEFSTFSDSILKIEICGPTEVHWTIIDVPGIFRNVTPGVTTVDDIKLVDNMVKSYMKDSRTIILAVIPCNSNIATHDVLKLAAEADPEGTRTMGVLTKPDLATEKATQDGIFDLVRGKRNDLKLGYYVVRNRGADDNEFTLSERNFREDTTFRTEPWSAIISTGRTGIQALKKRLNDLLDHITKNSMDIY